MTDDQAIANGARRVDLTRIGPEQYEATNVRGGRITLGTGQNEDFTPVELLLAAIAGCSGVDVDLMTARRAEPLEFSITSRGDKVNDERGHHMDNLEVTFTLRFPEGPGGDKAREMAPRAIEASRDRLCTVSRTVSLGTPITMRQQD